MRLQLCSFIMICNLQYKIAEQLHEILSSPEWVFFHCTVFHILNASCDDWHVSHFYFKTCPPLPPYECIRFFRVKIPVIAKDEVNLFCFHEVKLSIRDWEMSRGPPCVSHLESQDMEHILATQSVTQVPFRVIPFQAKWFLIWCLSNPSHSPEFHKELPSKIQKTILLKIRMNTFKSEKEI